ncbi:MAG TPA: hypothetical protein VJ600_07920, partial [Holophagaceae bacterium]|nr:hypothetical protein [Holophagaceae bacterium]
MKRSGRWIRVRERGAGRIDYREDLQALWEDRWTLVGAAGVREWFERQRQLPPLGRPADPTLILRGVKGLTPGVVKG